MKLLIYGPHYCELKNVADLFHSVKELEIYLATDEEYFNEQIKCLSPELTLFVNHPLDFKPENDVAGYESWYYH